MIFTSDSTENLGQVDWLSNDQATKFEGVQQCDDYWDSLTPHTEALDMLIMGFAKAFPH